jgi:hypothetical protein
MYKENTKHLQIAWISNVNDLPEKQRKRLEESWAGVFYREFFSRIDESVFAVLFSKIPSRPNVPVNVLLGLDTLKAGFGWSDEEMHDAFLFDVQVRYALGYRQLGDGEFDERTIYNFRRRVVKHLLETGENLIEKAFEQVTDQQVNAYQLKTGKLRMDSTQIASNICNTTRLRLLVEVLQRTHRMLVEADQKRYADEFGPYLKGNAGKYVYRVKAGEGKEHLQRIGELMRRLVDELAVTYGNEHTYRILKRVFGEHFVVTEAANLRPKQGKELSAKSLQSPDDEEASYRQKRGQDYVGYVGNLTETCDPENDFQLIVKVQVEPNTTDDAKMLNEALPELKKRTDLDEINVDGGYSSADVDDTLQELEIDLIQTAIRGAKPSSESLGLEVFQWEVKANGQPQKVTCPREVQVSVISGRTKDRFLAYFSTADCEPCPFSDKCPTDPLKRRPKRVLRFSKQQVNVARRRQQTAQARASGQNLRAAVEATVRSVKHPFRDGKVPVRGQPRVSVVVIGSAAMSNVRRIWRYLSAKMAEECQEIPQVSPSETSVFFFWYRLSRSFSFLFALQSKPCPVAFE